MTSSVHGQAAARTRWRSSLIERGAEYGDFDQYAHSHGDFENTVRDLKRQFRVIGDSGAYHFLWAVDEPTPLQRDWFKPRAGGRRPPARNAN
jgi:hypothetical protein